MAQNTVNRDKPGKPGEYTEVTIYNERTDTANGGCVIREMLLTKNESLRFQVGIHETRPMLVPVYKGASVSHYAQDRDIRVFRMIGHGRTKEAALDSATKNLLRGDVEKHKAQRQSSVAA